MKIASIVVTLMIAFVADAAAQVGDLHLSFVQGSSQTTTVGSPFPQLLAVRLTDDLGNPLPGATIEFENDFCGSAPGQPPCPQTEGHFEPGGNLGEGVTDSTGTAYAPPYIASTTPGITQVYAIPRPSVAPYFFTNDQVLLRSGIPVVTLFEVLAITSLPTLSPTLLVEINIFVAIAGVVSLTYRNRSR